MRISTDRGSCRIGRVCGRAAAGACLLLAGLAAGAAESAPEFLIGAYRLPQKLRTETTFRDMKEAGVDFIIDEFHNDRASLDRESRSNQSVSA